MSPRCSTISPLSVLGPSSGKRVPSRRLSARSGAMPSTMTLPSASRRERLRAAGRLRGELADDLLDDVLDGDEALQLAVFVDDEAEALAVGLELLQLRQQRRAGRDEIRRRAAAARRRSASISPVCCRCTTLLQRAGRRRCCRACPRRPAARVWYDVASCWRSSAGFAVEVERVDLVARRHHVVDGDRLEVDQVGEHRPVLAAEVLAAFEHQRAQLLLRQRACRPRSCRLDAQQLQQALHEQVDEPRRPARDFSIGVSSIRRRRARCGRRARRRRPSA